jgi:general secretion pathway protein A
MYENYFGLAEAPFSIAPDPRYLYMSQRHQEALAHLLYGVNGDGGFVLLTGEVGAGKTTVCRCLLEQIPESCDVAYVFNPKLTVEELLSTICLEFAIAYPPGNASVKVFVDCINAYLLDAHARGRHTVLVIDEAQNLSADVLEQMRLLTNLETNRRKLLQIILLGQPELTDMLERPELKQLAQRIVARYHLGPLSKAEVSLYVRHRLDVAGAERPLFPAWLTGRLHRLSHGIPRVINVLCDRALLGAYVQGKEKIDRATLEQAAREVFPKATAFSSVRRRSLATSLAAGVMLLAGGALAMMAYQQMQHDTKPAAEKKLASAAGVRPGANADAVPQDAQSWPPAQPAADSRATAVSALFRAWGAKYSGTDFQMASVCQQAKTMNLHCRSARGGLDDLRQTNRPAVLQVRDAQGQESFVTLTGLSESLATFDTGASNQDVPLDALAAHWSGEYFVLARPLLDGFRTIRPGEHGPWVPVLGTQLAVLHGRETQYPLPNDALYDEAMEREVKQFQLTHGLIPDGVVGPQTFMRLSSVADQSAPRLFREQGSN